MFNVIQWSYDNDLMVQFHPGDVGPVVVVLVSDKDCNAAEGYIRPDEPGLLEMELNTLKEQVEAKRYSKEQEGENGSRSDGSDA